MGCTDASYFCGVKSEDREVGTHHSRRADLWLRKRDLLQLVRRRLTSQSPRQCCSLAAKAIVGDTDVAVSSADSSRQQHGTPLVAVEDFATAGSVWWGVWGRVLVGIRVIWSWVGPKRPNHVTKIKIKTVWLNQVLTFPTQRKELRKKG
ncbi:hypothetical protein PIB30_086386 [Stylosanthes scabra]|uniref:Uncharacterized protein n=1 Tax=Stylosanthes scabra TaxID=79078 RepID=A0ABU6WRG2_9FABA|nr:hypothetical protein [Stylosanthes scabra]